MGFKRSLNPCERLQRAEARALTRPCGACRVPPGAAAAPPTGRDLRLLMGYLPINFDFVTSSGGRVAVMPSQLHRHSAEIEQKFAA